ncbi:MAG: POTRA domain-containing protein, partial [Tardiphaga sp.]
MEPRRRITHSSLRVYLIAIAAILLFLGNLPSTASAQVVGPGFDPLQPEKRFDALKQEQAGRDTPRLPATANVASARSGSGATFEVRGFSIVGNQTIANDEFQPLYQRYVGRKISERDLAELAEKITGLYRARGYHLARAIVPPQ